MSANEYEQVAKDEGAGYDESTEVTAEGQGGEGGGGCCGRCCAVRVVHTLTRATPPCRLGVRGVCPGSHRVIHARLTCLQ